MQLTVQLYYATFLMLSTLFPAGGYGNDPNR